MYGHVPHGDLGAYVAAFDVCIAPYRSKAKIASGKDIAQWISPLKIFEYMAAKKPIVCSDLPVIREVLNENNSILVPPSDVKGWVSALHRLKDDPALRQQLAEAGYDDLIRKYSWKQRARDILKYVDSGI
jgi:glycosyltransferase involved in cell wall biosynthesis